MSTKTAVAADAVDPKPLYVLQLEDGIRRAIALLDDWQIEYKSHADALEILKEIIDEAS